MHIEAHGYCEHCQCGICAGCGELYSYADYSDRELYEAGWDADLCPSCQHDPNKGLSDREMVEGPDGKEHRLDEDDDYGYEAAWQAYGAATERWRANGGEKPRAAWQRGRHIATLPIEDNIKEVANLPIAVEDVNEVLRLGAEEPPSSPAPAQAWPRFSSFYLDYLDSAEWDEQRRAALARAEYRCEECGASDVVLHVHHLTYVRLGDEWPEDLQVLCEVCHEEAHKQPARGV
jgi:hypothetical protein